MQSPKPDLYRMKKCCRCKNEKELDQFSNCKSNKDGKMRYCKTCQKASDNKHYTENTEKRLVQGKVIYDRVSAYIDESKKGGCVKCGEKRLYVLDYHHLDPSEKDINVSSLRASYQKAQAELSKCIVLCSNCHREFHHLERVEGLKIDNYIPLSV